MTLVLRRRITRGAFIVVYIVSAIFLFMFSRGHTLLVDNKSVAGLPAVSMMTVKVDMGKAVEFLSGDRDRFTVVGSRHTIRIEFFDGRPPFIGEITLPLGPDQFLLSVPKLIAGIDPAWEVFVMVRENQSRTDEEPNVDRDEAISPLGSSDNTL